MVYLKKMMSSFKLNFSFNLFHFYAKDNSTSKGKKGISFKTYNLTIRDKEC